MRSLEDTLPFESHGSRQELPMEVGVGDVLTIGLDTELCTTSSSSLHGGGLVRSKSFSWSEIVRFLPEGGGDMPSLDTGLYELLKYTSLSSVDQILIDNPDAFPLSVPLAVIVHQMNVVELRTLAKFHGVYVARQDNKASLSDKLANHACVTEECKSYVAVFSPSRTSQELVSMTYRPEYMDRVYAGIKPLYLDDLLVIVDVPVELRALYVGGAKLAALQEFLADECYEAADDAVLCYPVPWMVLAHKGNKYAVHFIAKLHGIPLLSRTSRQEALEALGKHTCIGCKDFRAVFRPVVPKSYQRNRRGARRENTSVTKASRGAFISDSETDSEIEDDLECGVVANDGTDRRWLNLDPPGTVAYHYPPTPLPEAGKVDIVRSFCDDLHPSKFEEAGCAVCGQLTPLAEVSSLEKSGCSLDPLLEPGLMRRERSSPAQPIEFERGPIIDQSCVGICRRCCRSLKQGKRPRKALANGLWLGEVPHQLVGLTYAEQCLIARVRSNRCVVRVSMGQAKMMANAVSFACPTLKVYQKLPPVRNDLDEVLAFIFTGVQPPNEDDLQRTPMLVRRNRVGSALEWLKLNHVDYHDLNIDYDTLRTYPESGIPVDVIFRKSLEDTNVIAAATSVHDRNEDEGASDGSCPLRVNGLIAENLESMSFDARRAAAIHHLQTGGHVLAVGHSEYPESMYENPQLYPQMYPWLFPYGAGGLGNARLGGLVSEKAQKKWMLTYHDKRFQMDSRFILVAFNHEQIKTCVTSSYILAKRRNFSSLASRVSRVDPAVVLNIANRLLEGERVVPTTEDEKSCFSLMDQIEHVGVTVPGTMAGRKRMRTNLWSMMTCKGSPSWFVTLSPVDINHPLCLYWADRNIEFRPNLRTKNDRIRLIAQNPVAGARFFAYMVHLFVKHLLRWEDTERKPGVFGQTDAYFGTVEQQGRMTLHLHMLVWVACSLSPSEIRERLLSEDSEFRRELITYLESCQVGEFLTGTMLEMEAKYGETRPRGSRKRGNELDPNDPTQRLPLRPPDADCLGGGGSECSCNGCNASREWATRYKQQVDHVMYVSNKHVCHRPGEVTADGNLRKVQSIAKGCINKDGICSARFPRETFEESVIDDKGRISLKKLEPRINTVNDTMVYCFGCNTDCTCLTSGTAVNATVGYVADYIVKMGLKTHQIFSSIYDVFEKNVDIWSQSQSRGDAARKLILKMANSLTSKMEIGAPMAAMYLLGQPDNYSSHSFVPLYWKQFHTDVMGTWEPAMSSYCEFSELGEPQGAALFPTEPISENIEDDRSGAVSGCGEPVEGNEDTIAVSRSGNQLVPRSSVEDYKLRPTELEGVCVYDWIQCGLRVRMGARSSKSCLQYMEGHPLRDTHGVTFDAARMLTVIPSIMGPSLPRKDNDDQRDYYSCVMLVLFTPWRSGFDLKSSAESWAEAFDRHPFSSRHRALIRNTNLRYECYDARDDYHAQMRQRAAALSAENDEDEAPLDDDCHTLDPDSMPQDLLDEDALGAWSRRKKGQMSEVEAVLHCAGWVADSSLGLDRESGSLFDPEVSLPPAKWKDVVAKERDRVLSSRRKGIPNTVSLEDDMDIHGSVIDDARIVPGAYLSAQFEVRDVELVALRNKVICHFQLNTEQIRAFTIIANHSISMHPQPLRMYIGGMGGTGKTTVIKALRRWFEGKGQAYRMGVLAPTGAAAAVVSGSTYHSFLGVRTGDRRATSSQSAGALEDARVRTHGMDYIFLDEISMVSCQDLYLIDSRLKDIAKVYDIPFGKINVIFAGDFAQLPPAKGYALYSAEVSRFQVARQTKSDQENTLGLLIWHQFTTVVMLTQNMRQTSNEHPDEARLRAALLHMRYKDCTEEDIQFLHSRVPLFNPHISLQDTQWKDISVITAWNTHKDQINAMNAMRFALEHNEQLHYFYSVDKLTQKSSKRRGPKPTKKRAHEAVGRLTPRVQEALWNSPPYTSDHFAGCLPLCRGMPVMIRHNEATELCITKGQEGIVKGWTCHEMATHPGKFVLDTLFVELTLPSDKTVQLPHLPKNVVPLTKLSDAISAVLPNDQTIHITRLQMPVLLNFSMTDYASQGKTRTVNVVDVKHCKNHQAMYTALSRGGLSGYLRQEFRDLDTLNEITQLQFEGKLPAGIIQRLRDSTIRAYKGWRLKSSSANFEIARGTKRCSAPNADLDLQPPCSKRLRTEGGIEMDARERLSGAWEWDSVDWSCAYDAYLSVILFLCDQNPVRWLSSLRWYGSHMNAFVGEILKYQQGTVTFDSIRQSVRTAMWALPNDGFPRGRVGTDLYALARHMSGYPCLTTLQAKARTCTQCGDEEEGRLFEGIDKYIVMMTDLGPCSSTSDYVSGLEHQVSVCSQCGSAVHLTNTYLPLISLQLPRPESLGAVPLISPALNLQKHTYSLAGVIYWGSDFHFASRVVEGANRILRYDGMVQKGAFILDTGLADASLDRDASLRAMDNRLACLALYAQDAVPARHSISARTTRHH